jgi:pyrroloquinoline-quinone synthase
LIGQAVVRRQWISGEDLIHYKLHAEIDKQHAADFFRLLLPQRECDSRRQTIMRGLRLGAYAFDRLYRDLLED